MKFLFVLFIFQFFILTAQTQEETVSPNTHKKRAIYMEAGGNSFASISLNYERFFGVENDFGLRFGFGYLLYDDKEYFSVPIETVFKAGSEKHKLEVGVGITYYIEAVYGSDGGSLIFIGRLGYSYNAEKGFLLRVGFTPMYEPSEKFLNDTKIHPSAGICIGYAF